MATQDSGSSAPSIGGNESATWQLWLKSNGVTLVFLVLAVFLLTVGLVSGASLDEDAYLWPQLIFALATIIAAYLLLRGTVKLPAATKEHSEGRWRDVAPLTFLTLAYLYLLGRLGFILASFLFVAVGMRILAPRGRWTRQVLSAFGLVAVFVVVFMILAGTIVPQGTGPFRELYYLVQKARFSLFS